MSRKRELEETCRIVAVLVWVSMAPVATISGNGKVDVGAAGVGEEGGGPRFRYVL